MPFALLIIGAVLLVSGVRNTTGGQNGLFALLTSDFTDTGQGSFTHWILAILVIGMIGYIDSLQKLSRMFLVLVIISMVVSNGGFFQKFNQEFFNKQ
jgi:hypothetical protein